MRKLPKKPTLIVKKSYFHEEYYLWNETTDKSLTKIEINYDILDVREVVYVNSSMIEQVRVPFPEWKEWRRNTKVLVQNRFPQLSSDEREFMISGIDEKSWDLIFNNID